MPDRRYHTSATPAAEPLCHRTLSGAVPLNRYEKSDNVNLRYQNTATGGTKSPILSLSAYEYDKKVKRKQSWNNFWVALGEGMAASNAGYSSSSTTYSGNSCSSVYGHASGYVGNTYGYANAYGSAYTTTYGRANTTTYNGAAAYAAQQQANANYQAYANSQYQVRQQLCEGYVKNNTIRNEVEYSGFFNIKYKKLDHLQVVFTIDGVKFPFFYWDIFPTLPKYWIWFRFTTAQYNPLIFSSNAKSQWVYCSRIGAMKSCWEQQMIKTARYNLLLLRHWQKGKVALCGDKSTKTC